MSSYEKRIYYAFLEILQDKADVDLQIRHYNPYLFEEIIVANLGKYDYYIVVPIFGFRADESQIMNTLEKITNNKLMFLDKEFPRYQQNCPSVFQDFEYDVFNTLEGCQTGFGTNSFTHCLLEKSRVPFSVHKRSLAFIRQ